MYLSSLIRSFIHSVAIWDNLLILGPIINYRQVNTKWNLSLNFDPFDKKRGDSTEVIDLPYVSKNIETKEHIIVE